MAGKQLVVMISSTMRDLQQHRQHVLDVGKDSGKKPNGVNIR